MTHYAMRFRAGSAWNLAKKVFSMRRGHPMAMKLSDTQIHIMASVMAAAAAVMTLLLILCYRIRARFMSKATLHEKVKRMVADVMVESVHAGRRWANPIFAARVIRKCARDGLRITEAHVERASAEILDHLYHPHPDDDLETPRARVKQ